MNGKWLKPPGQRVQHFILKPRDENLAQRHSACDKLFLFGTGDYRSNAKHCHKCDLALVAAANRALGIDVTRGDVVT